MEHLEIPDRQASLESLALRVSLDLSEWLALRVLLDQLEQLEELDSLDLLATLDSRDLTVKLVSLAHLDPMDSQVMLLFSYLDDEMMWSC